MRDKVSSVIEWYKTLGDWERSGVLFGCLVGFCVLSLVLYSMVAVFVIPSDHEFQRPAQENTVEGYNYYYGYALDFSQDGYVQTKMSLEANEPLDSNLEDMPAEFRLQYDVSEKRVLMKWETVGGELVHYNEFNESSNAFDSYVKWNSTSSDWRDPPHPVGLYGPHVDRQTAVCGELDNGSTGVLKGTSGQSFEGVVYGEMAYRDSIPSNDFRKSFTQSERYVAEDSMYWDGIANDKLTYNSVNGYIQFEDSYLSEVYVSESSRDYEAIVVGPVSFVKPGVNFVFNRDMSLTVEYGENSVERPDWVEVCSK